MLNNKKFNIILSLIIAVCLWAYVIGETNPTDTHTYRNVPITIINQSVLEENGLAVLSTSDEIFNVTVSGSRSAMNKVTDKDIVATVDLADAAQGENQLKINIKVPEEVEVEDKSINKITVVVEKSKSKSVPIKVNYEGTVDEDSEPTTVDTSKTSVTVSGAKSLVNKVDHIAATVAADKVTDNMKSFYSKLTPVDKDGVEVEMVKMSTYSIEVTSVLAKTKTVPLVVPIINDESGDIEIKYTLPKTITIKGRNSDIQDIESITANSIDISKVTEDTTIPIEPVLPMGVEVSAKSSNLEVTVTVEALSTKTFTFNGDDVELVGLNDDNNSEVKTDQIDVTVTGKKETLDALTKEDIKLSANLDKLDIGSHQVSLKVECNIDKIKLNYTPDKIKVTIE